MRASPPGLGRLMEAARHGYSRWAEARDHRDYRLASETSYPTEAERAQLRSLLAAALDDVEPTLYAVAELVAVWFVYVEGSDRFDLAPSVVDDVDWLVEATEDLRDCARDGVDVAYDWLRLPDDYVEGLGDLMIAYLDRDRCSRLHAAALRARDLVRRMANRPPTSPRARPSAGEDGLADPSREETVTAEFGGVEPVTVDPPRNRHDWSEMGPFIDANAVAALLRVSPDELAEMVNRNDVVALHPLDGSAAFPVSQFGPGLMTNPGLRDLWQTLRSGADEWTALLWLSSPRTELDGMSAYECVTNASAIDTRFRDLKIEAARDAAQWQT